MSGDQFTGNLRENLFKFGKIGEANPLGQITDTNSGGVGTSIDSGKSTNVTADEGEIFRVQLRPKPGKDQQIYGPRENNTIMRPLYDSGGVVFPYTPNITTQFGVNYGQYSPIHSIMDFYSYQRTPAPELTIMGTFTAQNKREASYALAVIHFFRTVTKMYFGQDSFEGNPIPLGLAPPILLLNGYGSYMFNNLPVLVTNYTVELLNNVDYVKVQIGGAQAAANTVGSSTSNLSSNGDNLSNDQTYFGKTVGGTDIAGATQELKKRAAASRASTASPTSTTTSAQKGGTAYIPSMFTITATLVIQKTPKQTREFNIESFRRGILLQNSKWPNSKGGWW